VGRVVQSIWLQSGSLRKSRNNYKKRLKFYLNGPPSDLRKRDEEAPSRTRMGSRIKDAAGTHCALTALTVGSRRSANIVLSVSRTLLLMGFGGLVRFAEGGDLSSPAKCPFAMSEGGGVWGPRLWACSWPALSLQTSQLPTSHLRFSSALLCFSARLLLVVCPLHVPQHAKVRLMKLPAAVVGQRPSRERTSLAGHGLRPFRCERGTRSARLPTSWTRTRSLGHWGLEGPHEATP
jgi:hypothetical protein